MSSRVFSAGESMNVFTPHDEAQNPIAFDKSNPLWATLDTGRSRVTVEICYCSTLGECWTLPAVASREHDDSESSVSKSVSDYLPAVSPKRNVI